MERWDQLSRAQDMTRPYFPGPGAPHAAERRPSREVLSQASQEQCISVSLPGPVRSSPRAACLAGRQRSRISPSEEGPQEPGVGLQRRRIAVACGRCRKRKIRCSGDPGDGTGCNNCKTSGTDPSQCQFLRVNSVDCAASGYPYTTNPLNTCPGVPPLGNDTIPYGPSQMSSNPIMGTVPIPSSLPYGRLPSSQTYPILSTKPLSLSQFSVYGDENQEASSFVSPSAMLPSQDSQGAGAMYGSQDGLRAWNHLGQASKSTSGLLLESGGTPYANAHMPLISSTGTRANIATTDGSPLFPGLASLSSSLPVTAAPTGERYLPRPHQPSGGSLSGGTVNETLPYGWDSVPLRSIQPDWAYETRSPVGDQDSRRASSGSSSTMYGVSTGKGSLSSQDASLGFSSAHTSAAPQEGAASTNTYANPSVSVPGMAKSTFDSDAPSSSTTSAGEPSLGGPNSSDLYSYTTGSSFRHGSHGTRSSPNEGTLVSGQPYTRLQQPHPTQPSPLTSLRRDSRETRAHSSHRPPGQQLPSLG